jgi:cell division protein FtsB
MQKTGWTRVGAVVLLTLGLIYVVKLSDLAIELLKAKQAAEHLETEVGVLGQQVEALETAAVDANSVAYTESFARDNIKLTRPGDQPFVTVKADEMPEPAPAEAIVEPSVWQRFLHWMRGDAEPDAASAPTPPANDEAAATSAP